MATSKQAQIDDKTNDRKYFTMLPNVLWELGLSCFDLALYAYIKRVAGESGTCWRSMRALADQTGMSLSAIDSSRKSLEAKGLITCEKRKHGDRGWASWHVSIIDVWQKNVDVMAQKRSQEEQIEVLPPVTDMPKVFPVGTDAAQSVTTGNSSLQKCSQNDDKEEPICNEEDRSSEEKPTTRKTASQSSFCADAVRQFESVIGLVSGATQADDITTMLSMLEERRLESWWSSALQIAADQNKRSWAYVRGILNNCLRDGRAPLAHNVKQMTGPPQKRIVTLADGTTVEAIA